MPNNIMAPTANGICFLEFSKVVDTLCVFSEINSALRTSTLFYQLPSVRPAVISVQYHHLINNYLEISMFS